MLLSPASIMARAEEDILRDIILNACSYLQSFFLVGHPRACRESPAFSQALLIQDPSQQSFYQMLNF